MYSSKLINLIFKNQIHDMEYYENKFMPRDGVVVRFAPSPTGFLHTGSLYTALINYLYAHQNNGIFYLRIEDTDTKRTVENSFETLTKQLQYFNIDYNNDELYAPYFQSQRSDIYNAVIIYMLQNDLAYPCFLSEAEIEEIKKAQQEANLRTGIYGKYAKYRNISEEEAIERIEKGESYVIRFKSSGDFDRTFKFYDLLRHELVLHENDFDVVILKQDGLPTYHFAHACDDHFMHTSIVIRGEEWLTSVPIHYELFNALGFNLPDYLHLDSIMKLDNGNKRKLSKRKDPEASVSFLMEEGYPKESLINYLLTLANSNYEEHLLSTKSNNYYDFKLSIDKMSKNGALFDIDKLNFISKETISYMSIDYLCQEITDWAKNNCQELEKLIENDNNKFERIINIGRDLANPRKEYAKFNEILLNIKPFYNEYYDKMELSLDYDNTLIKSVIDSFLSMDNSLPESDWLASLKAKARELGFAKNKTDLKENGLTYMFADYMRIIRNILFKRDNSPSLYDVIQILGIDEVRRRFEVVRCTLI